MLTRTLRRFRTVAFRKRRIAQFVLAAVGIVLGCLLIELLSYAYLRLVPAAEHVGRWEFRGSRPAPYRDADYFNDDFLAESMQSVRLTTHGSTTVVPGDFTGRYINVGAGNRRTSDCPAAYRNRVLLFGGSTLFSREVPDTLTAASFLQRLLNQRDGSRWRVENYGTSSVIAAQQTERLLQCKLHPGDVVIFYDGVNDVYYPIYNGNPHGWHPGDGHDGGVRRLSAVQRILYPLCLRFKDRSATARMLFRGLDDPMPRNVTDRKILDRHLRCAGEGYRDALTAAYRFAAEKQARFFHVLQPCAFSAAEPSAYESALLRNELKALPGLDRAYALGYPRLREAMASAAAEGVVSFDASNLFDANRDGQEYYLDFCHVAHEGNRRIASVLFDRIFAASINSHSPSDGPTSGAER